MFSQGVAILLYILELVYWTFYKSSLFQALPLLALINTVDPALLLKFVTEFITLSKDTKTKETKEKKFDRTFLPYGKMSSSQKDLVDTLLEEFEDFSRFSAVQAVNELGENAQLC